MGRGERRVRSVLDGQFVVVVLVLVAVTAAGGWLTYDAYAGAETTVEQQQGPRAQYTGSFTHRADVVVDSPVFNRGTTLRNRTTYFTRATPVLDGTFRYGYDATAGGNVSVDATVEAVFRSVADGGESMTEYWRVTRPLNRTSTSLEPGETLALSFSENVTELANESERYDESIGGTPGTLEVAFVADVTTEGTVNGRPVERSQRYELGVEPDGSVYHVDDPGTVENTTAQTQTVRERVQPSPVGRLGGPVLLGVGLLGLLTLGTLRYQDRLALSDAERAYLSYERDRTEYDEWITAAQLPPEARDGPTVEVASLEGLVDIAIDSDRRVIENGADGEYVTVVDDVVYRFTAPPEPDSDPLSPLVSASEPSGAQVTDDWEGDESTADEPATSTDGGDGSGAAEPTENDGD